MNTKAEMMARVAELRAASPALPTPTLAFDQLDEAIEQYFTATDALKSKVNYTLHQIALDAMNRGTKYERQDLMPEPSATAKPTGYDDIREIFTADGVWAEMLTIDTAAFVAQFETTGQDPSGAAMDAENATLYGWIDTISEAREKEMAKLQAVSDFCEQGSYNSGLAVIFEELGEVTESISKDELRERIYGAGGFRELNEVFNLGLFIPSALREAD